MEAKDVYHLKKNLSHAKFVETNVFSAPSEYEDILDYSYQLSNWCHYLYLVRGGSKVKSTVLPYPVKSNAFFKSKDHNCFAFREKHNIPKDAFVFGRIGQHHFAKWSLHLIDLFNKFYSEVDENCYLLIVNPPYEIIRYVNKKKVKHVIIIDELIGDNELRDCYSSIDLFLHIANIGESFGMVLAESALCETPVITLNTPWADNSQCEVVGNEIGGKCANNLNQFYKYMVELYSKREKIRAFGMNGRTHVINKYDYLLVAENSVNMVNKVYSNKHINFKTHQFDDEIIPKMSRCSNSIVVNLLKLKMKHKYLHRPINIGLMILSGFNAIKGRYY
jgi:glycosyltransferase involved in cell wall biosynthesis